MSNWGQQDARWVKKLDAPQPVSALQDAQVEEKNWFPQAVFCPLHTHAHAHMHTHTLMWRARLISTSMSTISAKYSQSPSTVSRGGRMGAKATGWEDWEQWRKSILGCPACSRHSQAWPYRWMDVLPDELTARPTRTYLKCKCVHTCTHNLRNLQEDLWCDFAVTCSDG